MHTATWMTRATRRELVSAFADRLESSRTDRTRSAGRRQLHGDGCAVGASLVQPALSVHFVAGRRPPTSVQIYREGSPLMTLEPS